MIGACGADEGGDVVLDALARDGIDVSGVRRLADVPTGTATILVEDGGENVIALGPGANSRWEPSDAADSLGGIDGRRRAAAAAGGAGAVTLDAARAARATGATVVLNAAPLDAPVPGLLDDVDLLVVNEHEVRAVRGVGHGPGGELARPSSPAGGSSTWSSPSERRARCCADPAARRSTSGTHGRRPSTPSARATPSRATSPPASRRGTTGCSRCAVPWVAASMAVTRPGAQSAIPRAADLPTPDTGGRPCD